MTFSSATPREKSQRLLERWFDLKRKREPFYNQWEQVSKYISPYSGRFDIHKHNEKRDQRLILDSAPSRALNILASGMMSGASSPARAWFKIMPADAKLQDDYSALTWCSEVEQRLLKLFHSSNTYNSLHSLYKELALFGTGADIILDDPDTIIRHNLLTAGEYCIETNAVGDVDTLYRNFELTTAQAVKFFGYQILPREIKEAYDRGDLNLYWEFLHAIEPRIDRDINSASKNDKPYASYYICLSCDENNILKEGGYDYFPCVVPRWDLVGIDPYGVSPSMLSLPDIKQLMQETLRKAELIENYTKPPVQAPNSARQKPISLASGAINFTQTTGGESQIRPIVASVGDLNALIQDIASIKKSIDQAFFVDLFMMVQQTAGDRRTTVEIYALQQEQMLTLGAVMERMQNECLGKIVTIGYQKLLDAGALPPMPRILKDHKLTIEYTSVLAQSQKAVDVNTVDRFFSALSASAQIMPEVLDRLDPDGYVDEYRDRLGVAPRIVRSREDAEKIRQQRAEAQQQAQQEQEQMLMAQNQTEMMQAQKTGAEASLAMQQLDALGGGGNL